jgi:hypothetical protein
MSKVVEEVSYFVREFVARVTGDDTKATALKSLRSANSALDVHISNMTGDLIVLEDAVEEAKENLVKARINNVEVVKDRARYINNLIRAKKDLQEAEEELADHIETLNFLKEEKEFLNN